MSNQDEPNSKLLTVEAAFTLTGRGLIVEPAPVFNRFGAEGRTHSCSVLIKRPDESTITVQASFYLACFSPLKAQALYLEHGRYVCLLNGVGKPDVPIGSEVYVMETP